VNKAQVFIHLWQNPDDETKWFAETKGIAGGVDSMSMSPELLHPIYWENWYVFRGDKSDAYVFSNDLFTREEALKISSMIIRGDGIKAWEIVIS
jgi:hypothetical protein